VTDYSGADRQVTGDSAADKLTEALSNSAGYLLAQASRLLRERVGRALAPMELSLYEYVMLRLISLDVPVSQGTLGETYGIDRTTMVGLVDRLEERELVVRKRNEADRRSYLLRLTPKGRKVLSRALRIVRKEQQDFLSPLSTTEWDTVRACLWKLVSQAQSKVSE